MTNKEEHYKTITQQKEERRRHKREIFNYKVELLTSNGKSKIKCAAYDLAEGGIRVVINTELKEPNYIVCIDNHKINSRLIHEEARRSTMMDQFAYYHGLQFERPISPDIKKKLLKSAEKFSF
jgi:c-di-GMP-binding flagellar brake protein YcgR